MRDAGYFVPNHDWHYLVLYERDNFIEKLAVPEGVAVEAPDKLLARVDDDLASERDQAQAVEGEGIEFERTLVLELLDDVPLDFLDGTLGVDKVVVEDALQFLEGVPGLFLEYAVAPLRQRHVEIRRTFFAQLPGPGAADFLILRT
jgi:hypothetical protein